MKIKPNNSWEIEKLNLVKEISKAMTYGKDGKTNTKLNIQNLLKQQKKAWSVLLKFQTNKEEK